MTEADLARFAEYAEGELKAARTTSFEWTEDPSLPEGWKSRMSEAKKFYLAPTNEQFPVRRLVLRFMVEQGYSEADLEVTRRSLVEEGWTESDLLPADWRFRSNPKKPGTNYFLTKDGLYFKSLKTTRDYAALNCSHDILKKLEEFAIFESRKSRLEEVSSTWEEDESLPQGWKLRHIEGVKGRIFYLAPNGDSFPSRQSALRFLIQNGKSQPDIEKMREGLHCENWYSHSLLPIGWKMRSTEKAKNIKVFLTRDAKFIPGYKKAAMFIKTSKEFSKTDSTRFEQLISQESLSCRDESYEWMIDQYLPIGWKFRCQEGKTEKEYFLAPDQSQYTSRRSAYQALIKQGATEEELALMREGLVNCSAFGQNWEVEPLLPAGWLYRETVNTGVKVAILSDQGSLFKSYKTAMDFMEQSTRFTTEDVDRLKKLIVERAEMRREGLLKQKRPVGAGPKDELNDTDDSLEIGHRLREVAPELKLEIKQELEECERATEIPGQVNKIDEVSEARGKGKINIELGNQRIKEKPDPDDLLTKNNIEQVKAQSRPVKEDWKINKGKQVLSLNNCIYGIGWESSPLLPKGWKFHQVSRTFQTDKGEVLQSYSKTLQHMMVTEGYSDVELDNMQRFIEEKDAAGEEWDSELESMEEEEQIGSVMDQIKTSHSGLLQASKESQRTYQILKSDSPLRFMVKAEQATRKQKSEWSQECNQSGKKRRTSDDWQSSPSIPAGWKVRNEGKGKAEYFLSPAGAQLPSRRAGLQFLVREGSSPALVEEMRSLLRLEGYQSHEHLPESWTMKYTFTDINNVWLSILNAEGDEFKSFLKAEEFMKADPRYSETHLEQLKLLVEEKAIERRLSDPAWRKDSSVPKGWKLRPASDSKSKSEKEFLLSKDGRQFPGRRVALKAMVEEGWDSVQVEEMRNKLPHEGWREKEGLPRNWFVKKGSDRAAQFVTETGEKLESTKRAVLWLRNKDREAEVCTLLLMFDGRILFCKSHKYFASNALKFRLNWCWHSRRSECIKVSDRCLCACLMSERLTRSYIDIY